VYEFYRYGSPLASFSNAEHIEVHAAIAFPQTCLIFLNRAGKEVTDYSQKSTIS
jgi:hypothetical protein